MPSHVVVCLKECKVRTAERTKGKRHVMIGV